MSTQARLQTQLIMMRQGRIFSAVQRKNSAVENALCLGLEKLSVKVDAIIVSITMNLVNSFRDKYSNFVTMIKNILASSYPDDTPGHC